MSLDLTFKSVCETIKKQGKDDSNLLEAVDKLLGLALICSPTVLGAAAAAFLPTLSVKNELMGIGKFVFEKLTKKKDEDYILRYETMRTAYGLLVFTSFFDELDAKLPDALRREIRLLDPEKAFIANGAVRKSSVDKSCNETSAVLDPPVSTIALLFPHPTETLAEQCQRQAKLWKQMSQGFLEFVHELAFWEHADEKKQASLLAGLDKIEEEVGHRFKAQYFELARKFEDFAIWANLQAHEGAQALIGELSSYVKQHAKLSAVNEKTIDVGFTRLRQAVLSIPETLRIEHATEISESFNKYYQHRINDPIFKQDKGIDDEGAPQLLFPKICDAFVPQAFKVLRHASQVKRLEDEATWNKLPRRNDLGPFLLSYLSSPYSTETPLLILGHPGSGKSLLTTVLSAQLMSKQFTAIRVPLRDVNADADIQTQIEEFIKRISGVGFDSWNKLRSRFKNCPPVVVLDGYDELLQASGQVFASYIMHIQRFQQHQNEQGWPVRIIITSRVTLIDKVTVPVDSTIVRLLEFDQEQRTCWSAIWNKTNSNYFRVAGIEKFVLPSDKEKGSEKILNLAEQPLLLLMLALYDSEDNRLRTSHGLDRTKLYDSLLRRFVLRELSRKKDFIDENAKDRQKALIKEMQRLGVAALGMYNRRKVHILSTELDGDLAFFKLEREVSAKPGKTLSQADLLLGSFFFVYESRAKHRSEVGNAHEESSAFEFLHNTFGEFLTADFVIRRAIAQVQALRAMEANEALRWQNDTMLGTADGFGLDWFASLVYTPLFTRPVILEMIREWAPHVLLEYSLKESELVESLDKIILSQIKRLLNKREMPHIMRMDAAHESYRAPFSNHPLLGHIAIYSINLVLLRLVAGKTPFEFDEAEIASHEDGTRPWDRLIHIWRSWFSLGNLSGLSAVMVADRNKSKIKVTAKGQFQAEETKDKLNELYNVAVALGDNVSAGIAGFYLFDPQQGSIEELSTLEKRLSSEGFDLGVSGLVTRLLTLADRFEERPEQFAKLARWAFEQAMQWGRRDQIETICAVIARTLDQKHIAMFPASESRQIFSTFLEPHFAANVAMNDSRLARAILRLGTNLHDSDRRLEFTRSFLDAFTHKIFSPELMESSSLYWKEWIRSFHHIRGLGLFSHYRYFSRDATGKKEALDNLIDRRTLLNLSERNPEGALAYLQILRELGRDRRFEEFVSRCLDPEFIYRMFQPRTLLWLSEYNPEGALAYLQIWRELSRDRRFEGFVARGLDPEFMSRMFDPRTLLDLSERSPEGALAYLQILRKLGRDRWFMDFVERCHKNRDFINRMFDPRTLLDLSERSPEGALAYLQILRELDRERRFEEFVARGLATKFIHRIFHPHTLLELSARNLEGALAYLQTLRELGRDPRFNGLVARGLDSEFVNRMFDPRTLLDLSEHSPEGALEYLQILRELDRERRFEGFVSQGLDSEFIHRIFYPQHGDTLKIHSVGISLAFTRLVNSRPMISALGDAIWELFLRRPASKSQLSALPIASLSDLRWLAEKSHPVEMRDLIAELLR